MTRPVPERADYPDLEVGHPKREAVGAEAVVRSLESTVANLGAARAARLLLAVNQNGGFDCMSCAWPDPAHRHTAEFCENGAKAITWEATRSTVARTFWAERSLTSLQDATEYWLGQQGRLVEPVHKPAGSDHYQPVSWERAFEIVGAHLRELDSPDEAAFYTSGRTANETAFLYQLFVRAYGTNNLPDCSNMCHESTGTALNDVIGVGKSTIAYDDFGRADLVIVMGQNPGTNHPRMLTALEETKRNGGRIIAVNPLPEAGLIRYKNPQKARGLIGRGTEMADRYLQIRSGGDMALLQAVSKRVLEAEAAAPGTVLDHVFLREHTVGLEALTEHLAALDDAEVLVATGLTVDDLDDLAAEYLAADRVIITWAMGLTQQRKAVDTIKEVVNLLLLRGNIGKPGAGASPIRGHSNVQGDRTMGISERMPESFLDALGREFAFEPPRAHGLDAVDTLHAMRDGRVKVFVALGGNFVGAISDTLAAEDAVRGARLTVQVSTKLNRSHIVTGQEALILPALGRTEVDLQQAGPQFVSVEDSVCAVHASHGAVPPIGDEVRSEVAIVAGMARATLGDDHPIDWDGMTRDYDVIRDHISRVVPGFEHFNDDVRTQGGFVLPNGPRDSRTWPTPSGRAHLTVNELEHIECPPGRLILQTLRSHDQFNTTVYSLNDRYRGVRKGRDVVFVNPDDLERLGLADGDRVDVVSEWPGESDRRLPGQRVIAYPTARGCAAAYFPEANVLVSLASTAIGSNTPVSKAVIVRLEKVA
ncbi:FdhF/YdeP family oxidoreductase [Agromyces humatus]|uniref:FdhF/YdeP family oxidoreductase n=1 Tax=Agromyces humatus TaxID=279573 RepID=A0ABN2K3U5_9MICO|nr:FdhF/YdeP family oxidoreductase [Agromyces humatus]